MSLKLRDLLPVLNPVNVIAITAKIISACVIIVMFPRTTDAQTTEDTASVYEFVKSYQHTIKTHDPWAIAAFFTNDADFVMYNLPDVRGRKAIENWWQEFWRSSFNRQESGRRGTFNLNSVRFLATDVALADVKVTTGGLDSLGVELQTRNARGTWLLLRQNGNWLISAIRGMPTDKDSVILRGSLATAKLLRPDIRAFVDTFEDAFNSHNSYAVSAFFRDDAEIIVHNSPLIRDKQEIQDWWNDYFSTPRPYRAILIIDEI